jgi:Xaa-Pro aminopeptidase
MFDKDIYMQRRDALSKIMGEGIILIMGNGHSSMNYASNVYPFRQDSNFLYFFGVDLPGMAGIIDPSSGQSTLFGHDASIEDVIWSGPQPTLAELGERCGTNYSIPFEKLSQVLKDNSAKGKKVHFLPPYRSSRTLFLAEALGIKYEDVGAHVSEDLIKAVVKLRSVKSDDEVKVMEKTLTHVTYEMFRGAFTHTFPHEYEYKIAGILEGRAIEENCRLAYPCICSVRGEILHNEYHPNLMNVGDMLLMDAGAESWDHYATDISRTIPVDGRFSPKQKEIYEIVLRAEEECIKMLKPGVAYVDVHTHAAEVIASGLMQLGIMKGDPKEAVEQGAHALFFPHGVGHMIGLDVHDMEDLGEHYTGYDQTIQRSKQFGRAALRFGREVQQGFTMTVEPGCYFIPALIDQWKAENKFTEFIDYSRLDTYRTFGGIRIEDNVLITNDGHRIMGKPIPKSITDIEELMNS